MGKIKEFRKIDKYEEILVDSDSIDKSKRDLYSESVSSVYKSKRDLDSESDSSVFKSKTDSDESPKKNIIYSDMNDLPNAGFPPLKVINTKIGNTKERFFSANKNLNIRDIILNNQNKNIKEDTEDNMLNIIESL
jgi:hypothetical protein